MPPIVSKYPLHAYQSTNTGTLHPACYTGGGKASSQLNFSKWSLVHLDLQHRRVFVCWFARLQQAEGVPSPPDAPPIVALQVAASDAVIAHTTIPEKSTKAAAEREAAAGWLGRHRCSRK